MFSFLINEVPYCALNVLYFPEDCSLSVSVLIYLPQIKPYPQDTVHTPRSREQKEAVERYSLLKCLSSHVMHGPLINLFLFFEFSQTQTGLCKFPAQAPPTSIPRLLQDLSQRAWQVWESVTLSRFSVLIEYALRLILIDDLAGRRKSVAQLWLCADGWHLDALRVTESLQTYRARVMIRIGWGKHFLSLLLPSLGIHLCSIQHCNLHHHGGVKAELMAPEWTLSCQWCFERAKQ